MSDTVKKFKRSGNTKGGTVAILCEEAKEAEWVIIVTGHAGRAPEIKSSLTESRASEIFGLLEIARFNLMIDLDGVTDDE